MTTSIVILVGPSGGGKTTLATHLATVNFTQLISVTTRPARPNEVDGRSYFFWSTDRFRESIENGVMLEYSQYCGYFYGNDRNALLTQIQKHSKNVIVLEMTGAIALKKWFAEHQSDVKCKIVFCYVPPEEQKRRLIDRAISAFVNGDEKTFRTQMNSIYDRIQKSDEEFAWSSNRAIDLLICCDEGSEEYNTTKIFKVLEK